MSETTTTITVAAAGKACDIALDQLKEAALDYVLGPRDEVADDALKVILGKYRATQDVLGHAITDSHKS
mgnify:CR=1 FL=1